MRELPDDVIGIDTLRTKHPQVDALRVDTLHPHGGELGLTELLALDADAAWTPEPGDITLSRHPAEWRGFLDALAPAEVPTDFLDAAERRQIAQDRDPLADIDP